MPILASKPADPTAEDQAILSWTVHLASTQPAKTVLCVGLIVVATAAGCLIAGPLLAGLVIAALVASLSDFLFPVQYVLTREKASCKIIGKSNEMKWADVKRCYLDDYGVKLSPLGRASRLEAFRGVYLRFGGNKDEVIETIKSLRPKNV